MDFDDHSKTYDEIRTKNDEYLELFEQDLIAKEQKGITIKRHLSNVDFYINTFLLNEEPLTIEYGVSMIDSFLGEFFIRKCMWSTPKSIKSMATSIKKFYKCMMEHGIVSKEDYAFLCNEIKNGMETWQTDCAIYNDPDQPNPFNFF
ncbi:MAG: hypothetical protein Q4C65_09865 [Eubacteriales bacterium]|nr:hypothetical protein [Eubacteriales bacterium]